MSENYEQTKEDEDFLERILNIPQKSLESRIKELEKEISKRQDLSDRALTELCTIQFQLKGRLFRVRYEPMSSTKSLDLHRQIWQLESEITREEQRCFHDLSELQEKLSQLKLEQEMSNIKFNLLK